jgi:hypothetical protein
MRCPAGQRITTISKTSNIANIEYAQYGGDALAQGGSTSYNLQSVSCLNHPNPNRLKTRQLWEFGGGHLDIESFLMIWSSSYPAPP